MGQMENSTANGQKNFTKHGKNNTSEGKLN